MEILPESTSNSSAVGSDDGVTTSFQRSHNSRPPMLDHQDKYMIKAQVHVSKSFAISDVQPLPRRKHYCQIYQVDNDIKIKIQDHRRANNESKEFPRTRLQVSRKNLLRELHTPLCCATLVYCDNVSAVYLSYNPVQHQRTKHIEIDIHFVQDLVAARQIRVLHVHSRYRYADVFLPV
nr:ribonuclease H-like domain-containing protein [Tanacetum cinerariifolium]